MNLRDETKAKMDASLAFFVQELRSLRTGKANPGMLDNVFVEIYDTQMRIRELANITTPEARQILITPFDPKSASAIAKGIERANLNLQPIVDGNYIRINIPPMDESMRKEIVKIAKKKSEEAKVAIREIRRKSNEIAKKQKADSIITEDVLKKLEHEIQELTDSSCKEIDKLLILKEKEIMTV